MFCLKKKKTHVITSEITNTFAGHSVYESVAISARDFKICAIVLIVVCNWGT
jgi:hypothetical protein